MLKMRLAIAFDSDLDFDSYDFSIDRCRQLSARELGLTTADRILHLSRSTICTVVWKRSPSRSMLIGVVVANGGAWIRPFARSACRMLSKAWLASAGRAERQPNYLQCLLIDRPENQPFGSGVATVAYEIRKDGSLARFEQRPQVIYEQPLRPDPRVPTFHRVETPQP